MVDPTKKSDRNPAQPQELEDQSLDQVAGGVRRRGGDEDLDDLEVERLR